jgi:hypothetical protein
VGTAWLRLVTGRGWDESGIQNVKAVRSWKATAKDRVTGFYCPDDADSSKKQMKRKVPSILSIVTTIDRTIRKKLVKDIYSLQSLSPSTRTEYRSMNTEWRDET